MLTKEELELKTRDIINALGSDEATILANVTAHGVKGRPRSPYHCILARLLHKELGLLDFTVVKMFSINSVEVRCSVPYVDICFNNGSLLAFLNSFDTNTYPNLIETV